MVITKNHAADTERRFLIKSQGNPFFNFIVLEILRAVPCAEDLQYCESVTVTVRLIYEI